MRTPLLRCVPLVAAAALLPAAPAAADTSAAVAGVRDPAAGVLAMTVYAAERSGRGLLRASVRLGGVPMDAGHFGDPGCAATATCPDAGSVALTANTAAVPDGAQRLQVTVEEGDGTPVTVVDQTITVLNAGLTSSTSVTVTIGTGAPGPGPGTQPSPGPGGGPPHGGPGSGPGSGPGAGGCRSPRLSVKTPRRARVRRGGAIVVRSGRRYRFAGRLKCVRGGRARPAKRGTKVVFRERGRRGRVTRRTLVVARKGRFAVKQRFTDPRVLVFRTGRGTDRARLRLRVRVLRHAGGRR